MKERIVITQDWLVKDMKAGMPELDKLFICQKIEQVPESFAELKELCKQYNNVIIGEDYIQFKWHLTFFEKGYIQIDTRVVAFRRTPAQQWEVFKSLMEETNENKMVKQEVEMPDGEKRFNRVQELHKEGYRTIQDTPNKVVLVKFVDE